MTCTPTRPSTATSSTACWSPRPSWTAPRAAQASTPLAQRHRLYRDGVRRFFRLDEAPGSAAADHGRLRRVQLRPRGRSRRTPRTRSSTSTTNADSTSASPSTTSSSATTPPPTPTRHHPQARTVARPAADHAGPSREFLARCKARKTRFEPLGVAQGWSPASYAAAVRSLQKIGYTRIAIGGMVPLKTAEILACLREIAAARDPGTQLHLLGITRCSNISRVRLLRGDELRQHVRVPAGIQRRQRQLPHRGPHLYRNPRTAG